MKFVKKKDKETKKNKYTKPRRFVDRMKSILFGFFIIFCFICILTTLSYYASPDRYTKAAGIEQMYTVIESDGGTYLGEVTDTIYSGKGEFQHLEGGVYEGSFDKSQRSGEGIFLWENGDSFKGTWKEDRMDEGVYRFSNGCTYDGTFNKDKFEKGKFSLNEAAKENGYENFSAEIANGEITVLDFKMINGVTYNGAVTGSTIITYPSGNVYRGMVIEGVRNGSGTFKWMSNGKVVAWYDGEWKNNTMNGSGSYYFSSSDYPRITGDFINGRPNGQLNYYKEAGNIFKTTWVNGKCTKVVED